jgi:hypothetical protein
MLIALDNKLVIVNDLKEDLEQMNKQKQADETARLQLQSELRDIAKKVRQDAI